jgi:hypothetical protein
VNTGVFGVGAQLLIAVLLFVLAIIMAVNGFKTVFGSKNAL